ncbi:MAG TPA: ABC transporter permease subunit [Clostridia bacterium]|nr:MAG: putative aliphatic sulfonates transport permease protein SsuC [Firmicutes bacterium ADurb.Bin356]HOF94115.1 ABC transporter permease subunit [Clostridia bacterium]HOR12356.1 ABC transporter permease subunit [Clostridia bacterium]
MRIKGILRGLGIALFWLGTWQLASLAIGSLFILPSPLETAFSLFRLAQQGSFWVSAFYSLLRILAGYLAAVLFGMLLGLISAALPFANALLKPLRSIMKATPVASIILLVVLWIHSNYVPTFTAFVMVLPLIWANVQEGIRATDTQLLEMAKLFHFGKVKTFTIVYLPSILPNLLAACATGLGFAWKAGVAAEVLAHTPNSIGRSLIQSKYNLLTADMFAWTALVIALSVLLEHAFVHLLGQIRRDGRWGVNE